MRRRVRHVVTENARVLAAAEVLRAGRVAELGPLLDASHASMRDDFEITVPTVDLAVERPAPPGALGARMTGGGFGGCIIALVPAGRSDAVAARIAEHFARRGLRPAGRLRRAFRRREPAGSADAQDLVSISVPKAREDRRDCHGRCVQVLSRKSSGSRGGETL